MCPSSRIAIERQKKKQSCHVPDKLVTDKLPVLTRAGILCGRLPMGGNATVPAYYDDEFKAMRPQDCTEKLFQTKLFDPVTDETTVLHHQSRYLQVWTGGLTTFGVDAVVLEPLSAMSDGFNVRLTNETATVRFLEGETLARKERCFAKTRYAACAGR
jgi:hypothetical protein